MDKNQLVREGVLSLIDKAAAQVRAFLRAYPDMRDHTRAAFAFLTKDDDRAHGAGPKKPHRWTKAERAKIGKRVSAAYRLKKQRDATRAATLADARAAKQAHAMPPEVLRSRRKTRNALVRGQLTAWIEQHANLDADPAADEVRRLAERAKNPETGIASTPRSIEQSFYELRKRRASAGL